MLYESDNVHTATVTPSATYVGGDEFVQFVCENLETAGWLRIEKVMATIKFTGFALIPHGTITLNGTLFEFVDEDPPTSGGTPVQMGGSINATLQSLGTVVAASMEWTYEVVGGAITFTVKENEDDEDDVGNGLTCSFTPSGTLGLYNFNPNGVPGQGITFGGGFVLQSQSESGPGIAVTVVTNNIYGNGVTLLAGLSELSFVYGGALITNTWKIVCSKYQFFLYVPGHTEAGTFFYFGSLRTTFGLSWANYATGIVIPTAGGNRSSLSSIGQLYYLQTPEIEYSGSEIQNTEPTICFPGYGAETGISKGNNLLRARDLVDERGEGFPYEVALAVCKNNAGANSTNLRILGYIWDAVIYSVYSPVDVSIEIDGRDGTVLMSQQGSNLHTHGSLCILEES